MLAEYFHFFLQKKYYFHMPADFLGEMHKFQTCFFTF